MLRGVDWLFLPTFVMVACGPSPERVCNHVAEIMVPELERSSQEFGGETKHLSAEERRALILTCVREFNDLRASQPTAFRCAAACAHAARVPPDFEVCERKCRPQKKARVRN